MADKIPGNTLHAVLASIPIQHPARSTHIEAEGELVTGPHFIPRAFVKIKAVEAFLVIGADVKEELRVKRTKRENTRVPGEVFKP